MPIIILINHAIWLIVRLHLTQSKLWWGCLDASKNNTNLAFASLEHQLRHLWAKRWWKLWKGYLHRIILSWSSLPSSRTRLWRGSLRYRWHSDRPIRRIPQRLLHQAGHQFLAYAFQQGRYKAVREDVADAPHLDLKGPYQYQHCRLCEHSGWSKSNCAIPITNWGSHSL